MEQGHFQELDSGPHLESVATHSISAEKTWALIKSKLNGMIDPISFQTWIEPLICQKNTDKELLLIVPNLVFYQGIIENYLSLIERAKGELSLDSVLLKIEVEGSRYEIENQSSEFNFENDIKADEKLDFEIKSRPSPSKNNLNTAYLFSNFVSGESNRFAQAAAEAVATNPGFTYNPLFIYGGTGLGKTHLLHAVGNFILKQKPNSKITYISSESFMNEMIYCIRFNKMLQFREKYRTCDVLLVDDIQFISSKDRTQEEFFHTFNSLYEAKKQIVLTSDMFPQDIPDIEERLRNRFQWGLIADIQPPDQEHRIAILYEKAAQLKLDIPHEVLSQIAGQVKRNVRELEGALHRLTAFASLKGRQIDLDLVNETFQNIPSNTGRKLTVELIQKIVAEHFKIKIIDLKSKKRLRALTVPRQIAMYLSREFTNASYPEIGDKFGGKDHTTVMHAVKKVEAEKKDLNLKSDIDSLKRKLEQVC